MGDKMERREEPEEPREQVEQQDEQPSASAKSFDERDRERLRKQGEQSRRLAAVGYIVAAAINLILLFVANNLLDWGVPFITREFVVPLRILNISLTATIIANLLFLLYDPAWFLAITRTALNTIGVVVAYVFYATFPFDFSSLASAGLVTTIVRIALILGIVGAAIGVVAELTKFIRAVLRFSRG